MGTQAPFVIIYNKRLCILCVFVTVQKQQIDYQYAEVKLVFRNAGNSKAAILNRLSSLLSTCKQLPTATLLPRWMSATAQVTCSTLNGSINAAGTSFDDFDKLIKSLVNTGGNKDASGKPYAGAAISLPNCFLGSGQDNVPQPIALQLLSIQTTGTVKNTSLYATPDWWRQG